MASITVINGSNILARNAIKSLSAKFPKINLCDFRPYRSSVYSLQRELEANNVKLTKTQLVGNMTLKKQIEESDNLLYFAHDYTAMTADNNTIFNQFLQLTETYSKPIVCVWPLEYHHFISYQPQTFYNKEIG